MPPVLSRVMIVAAWSTVALVAQAHSDDAATGAAPLQMDCDHMPAKAVTALPAPFDTWAQLECRPSGQFIVQGGDWSWRYPASFTEQVLVPAWMPDPDSLANSARYFKVISVSVAEGDKAMALHDQFVKEVVPYRIHSSGPDATKPKVIYTLNAVNDLGQEVKVHWVYRSDKDVWGIACSPQCHSEYAFMAAKRGS